MYFSQYKRRGESDGMTSNQPTLEALTAAIGRLGELAEELNAAGLRARVFPEHRAWPYLVVTSPAVPALSEVIRLGLDEDGSVGLRWSWGDPLDSDQAVRLIRRVLSVP